MLINPIFDRYCMPGRGRHWKVGGLKDSTVTSADIKDATIVAADVKIFVSGELLGDSTEESIVHLLGATPTKVICIPTEFGANTACDIAIGTHTSTHVKVTVSTGVKYQVWALV